MSTEVHRDFMTSVAKFICGCVRKNSMPPCTNSDPPHFCTADPVAYIALFVTVYVSATDHLVIWCTLFNYRKSLNALGCIHTGLGNLPL